MNEKIKQKILGYKNNANSVIKCRSRKLHINHINNFTILAIRSIRLIIHEFEIHEYQTKNN